MDDPSGDTGLSASVIVQDVELATGYAHALRAEGLEMVTIYNEDFPRRYIYRYWDSILDKRSPHPSGYPWNDPNYKRNVEYSRDMCPQTLSILARAPRFDFNVNMTEDHTKLMAAALNKVDAALGGQGDGGDAAVGAANPAASTYG